MSIKPDDPPTADAFSRLRLRDLLPVPPAVAEYSTGLRMGDTAEQMAKTYGITREQQDALAHRSHQRAAQAWAEGKLAEEVMTTYVPPYKTLCRRQQHSRRLHAGGLRQTASRF